MPNPVRPVDIENLIERARKNNQITIEATLSALIYSITYSRGDVLAKHIGAFAREMDSKIRRKENG
jgi:hypothetical protein